MALTYDFEEVYKESRRVNVTSDSFSEEFVFYMCGNFYEEASVDPIYGADDDIQAMNAAYSLIPPYRLMPLYAGGNILLTLSSLDVEQVDPDTWRVRASYEAQNKDQNNQNAGPNFGDKQVWSNNFVQLSFNVTAAQERRTMSRALTGFAKNSSAPNQTNPYTLGEPAPMGQTNEGAEGADVYVRGFAFSVTAYFTPLQLNFPYVRRLFRMATTINNNTFFGFPAGSVLFLEASASGDVFSTVPVTFDFQMRPNFKFTDVAADAALMDPNADDVADMYDVIHDPFFPASSVTTPFPGNAFSGWAVIDYRYGPEPSTSNFVVQKPIARLVHNVYERANFDRLEI